MKVFEHKGYQGSIEFDTRSECLHGQLLHIADMITYEASTMPELKAAFNEAVDDYLETCKEVGIEPKKPFKGVFNVRMKPELHQRAAMKAAQVGRTLNDVVNLAVEQYINDHKSIELEIPTFHYNIGSYFAGALSEVTQKPTHPVNKTTILEESMSVVFKTNEPVIMQ